MEITQLRYFKITAELENISKAADKLHIPQPYLSQTIKKLENELGMQLFDRVGKRIILNGAGRVLLRYTNQVLSNINNATLELNSLRTVETQDITVSFQCASMLIPQLMKKLMDRYPNLNFTIYHNTKDLSPTDIDITIYSSDKYVPKKNELFLLKEDLMIVLPKIHPLSKSKQINIEDLREERFISLGKQSDLYSILTKYYEQMNFIPKTSFYIDNPSVMREMLINGLGISIIPSITWYNITQKDMVLKSIKDYKMERYLYLAWNPQKYQTKAVKSCIKQILDYFKNIEDHLA